jgi:toxoflavin biosynthesis protein ToxC
MISHNSPISGIASHGNKYVATAGYDNQVILWESATKTSVGRGMHDHLANQCEFSPDGRLLATTSSDYTARIWEVPTMRLSAVLKGADDDVESISFHPSEKKIATSSRDGAIRIYDYSGDILFTLVGHQADVISVCWARDGKELISSSDDGTVRRWCATTGAQLEVIDFDGVETDTIAVIDDRRVIAGNDEGELIFIDNDRRTAYKAHDAGIKRVVYDRATGNIVSLSYDRRVKLWRVGEESLVMFSEAALPEIVWPRSCAFVNESEIAFVSFGCSYVTYDYKKNAWDLSGVDETKGINSVAVVGDDIYTVGDAGQVRRNDSVVGKLGSLCNFIVRFGDRMIAGGQLGGVFDAKSGQIYHQHRAPLNCAVAFSVQGKDYLAVGTYTGEAVILVIKNGVPVLHDVLELHKNAIKGLAWSENRLFSVCADSAMAIHSTEDWTLAEYRTRAHSKIANGCAALPGGTFASVSRDLKLRIWNGGDAVVVDTRHTHSIKCCAVSRDAKYIACGDYAGHVSIYNVALGRFESYRRYTASGISSITAYGDDGFIATSYDGRVYRVNALDGRADGIAQTPDGAVV